MSDPRSQPSPRLPQGGSDDDRLRRLEEHVGYAEYTLDQFSAELAELHKRMASLLRRIDALEQRLGELSESDGDDAPPVERPPHSAGPSPSP